MNANLDVSSLIPAGLMVNLTTANIADSAGAQQVIDALRKRWPWIKHLFVNRRPKRTPYRRAKETPLSSSVAA